MKILIIFYREPYDGAPRSTMPELAERYVERGSDRVFHYTDLVGRKWPEKYRLWFHLCMLRMLSCWFTIFQVRLFV